jgi:hypothetical protein
MDILSTDQTFNELNYASPNVVYISLPDSSSTCGSWLSELPSLPSGWSYHCSATPTNIDGTGWIPIPFSNFPILNISQLFIDPINQPPYYYSFVVGGSYEVTAALEADSNKGPDTIGGKDGGDHNFVYEVGTNKKLTPSSVQARAEPDSLKQGLVLWLTFDEGTGTTTKDLSGNNNNGTLLDASSTNADGNTPPQWTTGKVGGALSFDGVDDYVRVSNIVIPTNAITISFWIGPSINLSAGSGRKDLAYGVSYPRPAIIFNREGDGKIGMYVTVNGVNYDDVKTVRNSWSANIWYHITFTFDSSTFKIYVNGVLENSIVHTGTMQSITGWDIGGRPGAVSFPGLIDEVRIYNRALSDAEIQALYNATK